MTEKKRQCGTCRFFMEKEKGGHGKCTHPKRAGTDAELLLLRPSELGCRTKWGTSLWQDPADDSDPNEIESPQQPSLPEPIAAQLQFDDEVTSVSIAGSKSSRSSFEDDVVDSGVTGMASWNDPVQTERLDLLRKGSHDAVAGARKRHMEKQARQRELVPFADDDPATKAEPKPAPDEREPAVEPLAQRKRSFPPEDFVEEERTSAEDDASLDDEMVNDGVSPEQSRSPRLRKLLREPHNPKRNEAMRVSMPSEMRVTSHNPEHREQWNSVPTLNPSFELPMNKSEERPVSPQMKISASAAPMASTSYQPRPVSQARELLSEDRLRQERAQRQMVAPLPDEEPRRPDPTHAQNVTDRPRLKEAPSQESAPLDRIKSSPLRGYHPATRKLTQPAREQSQPQSRRPERPVKQRVEPTRPDRAQEPRPSGQRSTDDTSPATTPEQRPQQRPTQAMQPRRREHSARDERPVTQVQAPRPDQREQQERRPQTQLRQDNTPYVREEIEISPQIPRACGTCTSYRPSKVPGRGSCTNGFAGPVQRVVYEQDLSCQHTFGSFWLPADEEVWLEELEDNMPPTPRVDAMLVRRRRKNTTVLPDLEELTS